MRILLVTATAMEIAPLVATLQAAGPAGPRQESYRDGPNHIDVLTTGVGMVATAAWCSRALSQIRYDLALNLGVCGAFDRDLAPGTVVHVITDRLAELGAQNGDAFLTVQELQLLGADEFPFEKGQLVNPAPPVNETLNSLPLVRGITVNTAHGDERSIADVVARFAPQVETMEGAAFMYCCLTGGQVFAQVRGVSNVVEKRSRASWKMEDAIRNLTRTARSMLDSL
jgi:futalosine hydrolase